VKLTPERLEPLDLLGTVINSEGGTGDPVGAERLPVRDRPRGSRPVQGAAQNPIEVCGETTVKPSMFTQRASAFFTIPVRPCKTQRLVLIIHKDARE